MSKKVSSVMHPVRGEVWGSSLLHWYACIQSGAYWGIFWGGGVFEISKVEKCFWLIELSFPIGGRGGFAHFWWKTLAKWRKFFQRGVLSLNSPPPPPRMRPCIQLRDLFVLKMTWDRFLELPYVPLFLS